MTPGETHMKPDSHLSNPPANRSTLNNVAVACALLAAAHVLLNRLCWADIPLQTDTGLWAYIGGRILEGALPYRDLWESKPLGIYYLFAAMEWVWGDSAVMALVWLDGLVSSGVLLLAYRVGRRFAAPWAVGVALLPLSLVFCHRILADWGNNVEKFVAMFEMGGLLMILNAIRDGSAKRRNWLLAGLALAGASLFKQTGISLLISATVVWAWSQWRRPREVARSGRELLWLWIGFSGVWVAIATMMASAGNLRAFIDQVVLYDLFRAGASDGEGSTLLTASHWHSVWDSIRHALILFGPAFVAGIGVFFQSRTRTASTGGSHDSSKPILPDIGLAIVTWYLVIATIPAILAPHGYGHYLLQPAPVAAVFLAIFVDRVATGRKSRVPLVIGLGLAAVGAVSLGDHIAFTVRGDTANGAYAAQRERMAELAAIVRDHSTADQRVMLWPPDYAVSYDADRATPLECSNADVIFKGKAYRLSPPMDELLERLKRNPPDVIVDSTRLQLTVTNDGPVLQVEPAVSLLEAPDPNHPLPLARMLAPLKKWIRANYGGQVRQGRATVYRRAEPWREWEQYLLKDPPNEAATTP